MKGKTLTDDQLREYLISLDQKILSSISEENAFKLSDTFEYKMKKIIKDQSKALSSAKNINYLKKAAALLLIITTINTLQNQTTEAFIERTIKSLIRVYKDRTEITLGAVGEGEEFRIIDPSYIPEGYKLEKRKYSLKDIKYNEVYYKNADGDEIRYAQSYLQGLGMTLDTENLEEDEIIEYRGQKYRLMLKNGNYRVHWYDLNCIYWLDGNISREDMIKIVESVIDSANSVKNS